MNNGKNEPATLNSTTLTSNAKETQSPKYGAEIFKRFIRLPARYCNQTVRLQIRIDGEYGTWRLKDELFGAFNLEAGNTLFLNDVYVMNVDLDDIDDEAHHLDLFVTGEAIDWIFDNEITIGDIIEGYFTFQWAAVPNITGKLRLSGMTNEAHIATLLLADPDIKLVSRAYEV